MDIYAYTDPFGDWEEETHRLDVQVDLKGSILETPSEQQHATTAQPGLRSQTRRRSESTPRRALFAMSGDPVHYGHVDVISRAAELFDSVSVGIGVNTQKQYLFSLEERLAMTRRATRHLPNVEVVAVPGLTVDYAYEHGISAIVKGVRDAKDYEYETLLHEIGESQELGIETLLLPARKEHHHFSSTAVKELQKYHGLVHGYVPLAVKQALEARISGQYVLGVTGDIACGKSAVSEELVRAAELRGIPAHHIDIDKVAHDALERPEIGYARLRDEIEARFPGSRLAVGSIDRKALGERVFGDRKALETLNTLLLTPILVGLRSQLFGKRGLVLIEGALLAEAGLTYLANNNVLVVTASDAVQHERLAKRGLSAEQIDRRLASQYRTSEKVDAIHAAIARDDCGRIFTYDTSAGTDAQSLCRLLDDVVRTLGVKEGM